MNQVETEINRLITVVKNHQANDGSWRYCVEGSVMTDAYMIILLRTLNINNEDLIRRLTERVASKQEQNGAWKLFYDEEGGNLSATVEAYYALLFSGYHKKSDENMQAARHFILSRGGITEVNLLTKVMLALTGQYPWSQHALLPPEIMLLPLTFPVNFFDLVGYARVHVAPILIVADRKFFIKTQRTPDLSDINVPQRIHQQPMQSRSILALIESGVNNLLYLPDQIHHLAIRRAEQFMLDRIEPDGTLYSYFSSTFLMIFAFLALGYSDKHPVILHTINGLKALTCKPSEQIHTQIFTSTIWDTALLSYALQEARVPSSSRTIQQAGEYLLSRQHKKYGDWIIHNPHVAPGGWGFSDINTINPDVDDTTAALRAIRTLAKTHPSYRQAWDRGVNWVLSMQNDDGGWPAFEKNVDKELAKWISISGFDSIGTDPSSADLTGRTLQFLGDDVGLHIRYPTISRGVHWLMKQQKEDGSWYGRWGISYIYGTWAAITGMNAVGISSNHPAIQKAVRWLVEIQNSDGGWGESCKSDIVKKYVPLGFSTPSQTAWAVDALLAVSKEPTPAIERGIQYLIGSGNKYDWTMTYPTGAGLPGGAYFHYHSYRYIWPLLALSHYKLKSKS
ncbi:sporulene cyclase [Aneurinibacillus soli]|uniref:Sporulenol synthase n=1 Tax=Aneurinibacillus soli TaxID=1500254 RepID=A0A0U4WIZ3_9BACL|nr:squalene--hopene cyclase [Aneurinibacillus soli]PYE61622.1 sporulene cyclase [Aneurinibacillus soli]BAU28520.1 Sporulenol synthase [Aneurinibacillus soli]